ncbi:MAG TPA: DUF481 domain-containing protein [Gemmatimonadaceae bacterium]
MLVGVVLPIRDVRAQELRRWRGSLEASGHALFGAASSRLISFTAGGGRADSLVEVQSSITLAYADATSDDGDRSVTARSYRVSLGIDQRPFARISSFVFGSTEASLQQRVANRLSGGAGAKLTLQRKGSDDVSASLAILAERTRVLHPLVQTSATAVRTRWSLRVRFRRQLSDVVHLSHVLFYQPAVDRLARYTTESNTSLDVSLSKNVALMSAFRSRYDSEARQRGARSNHDGQLLFGVRATL